MKVICRNTFSDTTGENLGESSPWLKVGKEYVVLAIYYAENSGFHIYLQSEDYNEPYFFDLKGFEFTCQKIPSLWITICEEIYGQKIITMLPPRWNYESFFGDIADGDKKAVQLFIEEAQKIYDEVA